MFITTTHVFVFNSVGSIHYRNSTSFADYSIAIIQNDSDTWQLHMYTSETHDLIK